MATAKSILQEIRTVVAGVSGISRVNSNRKKDAPATGKTVASVLYRGETIDQWIITQSASRMNHTLPIAIDVRTTSSLDEDLLDKLYAILDAVLDISNKPTGVVNILPVDIEEPTGEEYLTCRINLNVIFRRS